MWAGTFGGGVSSFFDGDWFTMHEADGLNSNLIGAIVALDTNKIVIGGNKGISIFTIDDKPFKLAIENVVTPKADIMLSDLLNNNLEGVKRDRFYINTNPMLYKPTESNIKYRKRVNKVGDKTNDWSPLQVSTQISFIPERVGEYNLEIQAVENRVSLSNIVTIPFVITRVWYLNPKTAIPFWGSIILLFGISITNFINYRRKSKEAQDLREAEIARQQAEMEEAREFQQGMLPVEMPTTDDYEMVGFQQTATEVGGDFFDFMQKKDGKWVAICGDATGHGLTSGNVVSITKTAMNALVEEDPVSTLDSLNKTLLKMKIGLNRMCLNIANIQKDTIQFSSAGMPPAYFYSAENEEIEEILVGALPLGSFPAAVHMLQEIPFKNKGDILIMMSDGLPEAENINNEMVGYERTLEAIKSMASKSAAEIKNGLVDLCKDWLGSQAELKDDMTFVIIKKIK
jgi:serine phosphatase RsbU (regulator of sigma subunit)